MAVELCSDSSGVSPRISFSHDLCQSDIVPVEQHPFRPSSSSSIDFEFCVRKSFGQDSSSADELFYDGKILPTEIKKKASPAKQRDRSLPLPRQAQHDHDTSSDDSSKKECSIRSGSNDEGEEKQSSKSSFWRFKRSSSLNCSSGYGRRSLCPLPLLSRSYSTGSTPSSKRATLTKDHNSHKQQHKHSFIKSTISQSSSSSSSSSSSTSSCQKPPILKKNYGPYGNGVRVSPVLNVPSGNLFGLGSIFFNGKDKNKKK